MSLRKDQYTINIQPNLHVLVFHKDLPIGYGSAVSLYVNNIEFLKFDCFGKSGHYHIMNGKNKNRIWFSQKDVEWQILKTHDEMLNNITLYLSTCDDLQIKNDLLKDKMEEMKNKMFEYEKMYYSNKRNINL